VGKERCSLPVQSGGGWGKTGKKGRKDSHLRKRNERMHPYRKDWTPKRFPGTEDNLFRSQRDTRSWMTRCHITRRGGGGGVRGFLKLQKKREVSIRGLVWEGKEVGNPVIFKGGGDRSEGIEWGGKP